MATLLYRLGTVAFRKAWAVIGAWFVVLLLVGSGALFLGGSFQDSYVIPGTDSQEALDRLDAVFPETAKATAQVVYQAEDGSDISSEENRAAIEEIAETLSSIDGVDSVMLPWDEYAFAAVSDDGSMAITTVSFEGSAETIGQDTIDAVTATASEAADDGLLSEFGGQVFQDTNVGITIVEVFGVLFAAVVLLITFGSLLAAGMPLLGALVGVGIALAGIAAVTVFTEISSTTLLLAMMIGLAVGIDYALFILSRHRTQLAQGIDPEESAGRAVATAGSAVIFAGVTVIVALLGLLVVGIPFLSTMGLGAAAAVLLAIAVAITLLPALLGLAGHRLAPKPGSKAHRRALADLAEDARETASALPATRAERKARKVEGGERPTMGRRWVTGVLKAPIAVVLAVVGVLGVLSIPAFDLQLSLPDNGREPAASTQRQAYDMISEGFGPGRNGPLIVAVDITQTTDVIDDLAAIGDRISALDDVAEVSAGQPNATIDTAVIQVIPEYGADSVQTQELVLAIRALDAEFEADYGTAISVTGTTAVMIDISARLGDALLPFGVIVVGLSILLLMIVFRSIWVPIKAAAGFLLSVLASFGVVVAVFQWGWGAELLHTEAGPILSFMPIIAMAVLFGLAMDYEVFLVSGMRESFVHTGDARRSIVTGFSHAARVVTAAALIMFFVFFAFVPEGMAMIKPIALALAAGVLFDAFLIRMTLVPAVMALLGRHAWWLPRWLDRLLPNVDIEGESLREHREAEAWVRTQQGLAVSAAALRIDAPGIRPLDLAVPEGSLTVVAGETPLRRVLTATLAARLAPLGGLAQVDGHPLSTASAAVLRRVSLASLDEGRGAAELRTVTEVLGERIRLARGPRRLSTTRRHIRQQLSALSRVSAAVGLGSISGDALIGQLPVAQRRLVFAAAALAEGTPVVILDEGEQALLGAELARLVTVIAALAERGTTVLLGSSSAPTAELGSGLGRPLHHLDLAAAQRHDTAAEEAADDPAGAASQEGALR